jgi:hypothetical protein
LRRCDGSKVNKELRGDERIETGFVRQLLGWHPVPFFGIALEHELHFLDAIPNSVSLKTDLPMPRLGVVKEFGKPEVAETADDTMEVRLAMEQMAHCRLNNSEILGDVTQEAVS